jgi:prepilin-type N-terminal cleavage/methylation domain-containing protein
MSTSSLPPPRADLRGHSSRNPARNSDGFTLLEVLVAMAILAFALTIITAGASSSAVFSKRVYRSTAAALLLRGAVLDIEERYRKKGFPTNDVNGKDCELPKVYAKQFKCTYDLIGLNLDDGIIADISSRAQQNLTKAQEGLAATGALDKLSSPGAAGADKNKPASLSSSAGNAQDTGLDLTKIAKGGDLMGLLGVLLMSGEQGMGLLSLCDINISVLQMSMGLMVSELLPRVLKRASDRTRKVVLRLSWKDDEVGVFDDAKTKKNKKMRTLVVETFTTAVSEEESNQIQQMKNMEKVQNAVAPPGMQGMPPMGMGR